MAPSRSRRDTETDFKSLSSFASSISNVKADPQDKLCCANENPRSSQFMATSYKWQLSCRGSYFNLNTERLEVRSIAFPGAARKEKHGVTFNLYNTG